MNSNRVGKPENSAGSRTYKNRKENQQRKRDADRQETIEQKGRDW